MSDRYLRSIDVAMKEYLKLIEDNMRDKKHIVITGDRGSGKTTLLNEVRDKLMSTDCTPGLVTWAEPGKGVFMRGLGCVESVAVGEFDPNIKAKENRMKPVPDGFELKGVLILDNLINSDSEWVTIDEIGYLERTSPTYLKKIDELFDRKRVMAVVRKQEINHINAIIVRDDAFTIDLDCFSYR